MEQATKQGRVDGLRTLWPRCRERVVLDRRNGHERAYVGNPPARTRKRHRLGAATESRKLSTEEEDAVDISGWRPGERVAFQEKLRACGRKRKDTIIDSTVRSTAQPAARKSFPSQSTYVTSTSSHIRSGYSVSDDDSEVKEEHPRNFPYLEYWE